MTFCLGGKSSLLLKLNFFKYFDYPFEDEALKASPCGGGLEGAPSLAKYSISQQ